MVVDDQYPSIVFNIMPLADLIHKSRDCQQLILI